jgi:hypothetical protein
MSLNTIYKVDLDALDNIRITKKDFQRLCFINNAINAGWSVKKRKNMYIFSKKTEVCEKIFTESYLDDFVASNNKPFSAF